MSIWPIFLQQAVSSRQSRSSTSFSSGGSSQCLDTSTAKVVFVTRYTIRAAFLDARVDKRKSIINGIRGSKRVSVIILTRNSAQTIGGCIESVVREEPREIIAVDAQSTDSTVRILRRYGVKTVTDRVRSLGFARQLGVNAARGDFVMFVDSDIRLGAGCIETMLYELEKNGWAGIHARLLSAENVSYWQRAQDQSFLSYYDIGPIRRIDTIAAMFRRDVLLRCPFDPYFSESAEDVDLSRRLIDANYELGVSSAVAYHLHRREFSAFVRQRYRNGLGIARISLKYNDTRALIEPSVGSFLLTIRDMLKGRIGLVPFRLVTGLAIFVGIFMGYSRLRPSLPRPKPR